MAVTVLPESSAEAQVRVAGGKQAFTSEQPQPWRRPSDWLTLPSVAQTDDKFVGLYAVTDDEANFLALNATVAGATSLTFANTTSGSDSTDAATYTTASVTLTAGTTYLLSVENSHGSDATAVSAITGSAASVPTFTSRGTTQFNSNLNRVTVLSCVPTTNWTGTLTINFGGTTQTGACWVLDNVTGTGNLASDGVVQVVTGTGSSTSPSVTLAALATGSGTYGVQAHAAATASTAGAGYTEIADVTTATPGQALQTERLIAGSTTVNATITSAAWGMIGVELRLGTYTVDWGDATSDTYNSGTQANHQYTYSGISAATASTRGYRQVLVTLTPNGSMTTLNTRAKHSQSGLNTYEVKWLDVVISGQALSSLTIGASSETVRTALLERVRVLSSATTSWSNQFANCRNLQSLSIASSQAITSTLNMFLNCHQLQDVPMLDTSSVTSMANMFQNCYSLQAVPTMKTPLVTNMSSMFSGCYRLTSGPSFTTTSAVTTMKYMFTNCTRLETTPLYDTSAVTDMQGMFAGCSSLQTVPHFDTSNVTLMGTTGVVVTDGMFYNCSRLTEIPQFNTAKVTAMGSMFQNCSALRTVPLLDTSKVTYVDRWFSDCYSLHSVPAFTTSAITIFNTAFAYCSALSAIPLLNATSATSAIQMFTGCNSLAAGALSGMRIGVDYSYLKLPTAGIESIFDNLGKASGAQTVTISGNVGAPAQVSKTSSGTTSGSATVTIANTSSLVVGMEISGTGISDAVAVTFQDTGDTVTRTAHGIPNDTRVGFATIEGPTSGIATYTPYYVVNATADTFQVSDTLGGSAKALGSTTTWTSMTSGSSSTDATTYTTASVTLTAGRLYLLSIENSHGSDATAVSAITGSAASVPTFTSRGTTQFNGNLNRVTVLSAVPSATWTGTLTANFGGTTQTGACWSLVEVKGVDTASNDGVVQAVTATGNSGTASVTLAALGDATNDTFGAQAHASTAASAPVGSYVEIHDVTASTPAQALQTQYLQTGDTTVSSTFASAQWGIVGVELKQAVNGSGTVLYGTTIASITANTSVELSIPASATGSVTTSSAVLKRSKARIRGYTVSG